MIWYDTFISSYYWSHYYDDWLNLWLASQNISWFMYKLTDNENAFITVVLIVHDKTAAMEK